MDDQFDNHLKNHIREVFEHFEDPSDDAGWMLLRKKFPEKKKYREILWLWLGSAAALLLLLLGIGTWVNVKKDKPEKFTYKPAKSYHPENKSPNEDQALEAVKKQNILKDAGKERSEIATANIHPKNQSKFKSGKSAPEKSIAKNTKTKPASNSSGTTSLTNKPDDNLAITNKKFGNTPVLAADTATKNNIIAAAPQSAKPNVPLFTDKPDKTKKYKVNDTHISVNSAKKVQFSIYAATYFNYAKGSNTQLNLGAGATADIKLTNNLKLSTGMAIAQNTLNYAGQSQSISPVNLNTYPVSTLYNSALNAVAPALKNYNAQLVDLDVPVNLKYEFNPQKNNSYVAVGLSSGTFINESYTYQYGYVANNTTQSQTTNNSFNSFYFARTLNVSFGLGYPLGKNHLILEPFLKYPLDGLGSQQIRFGAGGVNLKFDFINSKK
jgi:hypothetical protein